VPDIVRRVRAANNEYQIAFIGLKGRDSLAQAIGLGFGFVRTNGGLKGRDTNSRRSIFLSRPFRPPE
jgi:hypothetical protein